RGGAPDLVATACDGGVPMGGDTGRVRGRRSPRFGVLAFADPGTPPAAGTPLQRVQIVKGWVDASGEAHEKVFDVAGDAHNDAAVDTTTCTPSGTGSPSLCAVWSDPEFHATERAFYYARVLESPTCRWSRYLCNAQGIDCSNLAALPTGHPPWHTPDSRGGPVVSHPSRPRRGAARRAGRHPLPLAPPPPPPPPPRPPRGPPPAGQTPTPRAPTPPPHDNAAASRGPAPAG